MTTWDRLVGQERAAATLQRAAERPVHAYLLVGARGSGVEDAARCFAAALVAPDDARVADLAWRGMHPDVVEFEPEGTGFRVNEDVRQRIIPEASRSPVEGARKVVVLFEADRLSANAAVSANALLKTLEEPPARTVLILVTAAPDDLPETVRSRCQRIDVAPRPAAAIRATLEAEGVDPERAALAAARSGGQLGRARALAGPLAPVREAFVLAADGLDGRTGSAVAAAETIAEVLKAAVTALEARHAEEAEALAAELEAAGYPERSRSAVLARLTDRHKREHRAARRRALGEGIAALEARYCDALAGAAHRDPGSPVLTLDPAAATAALDDCRLARESLARNPNEALLVERLLVHLPAARSGGRPGR